MLFGFQAALPATFRGGGPTWRSNVGTEHRIGFLAVPVGWTEAVQEVELLPGYFLAIEGRLGHRAVMVEVYLQLLQEEPDLCHGRRAPGSWYNRHALQLPHVQEAIAREWAEAPPLPSEWPADLA